MANEDKSQKPGGEVVIPEVQAVVVDDTAKKACQKTCRELGSKVYSSEQEFGGKKYTIYSQFPHIPEEQPDGTWKAVQRGTSVLADVRDVRKHFPKLTEDDLTQWDKVKSIITKRFADKYEVRQLVTGYDQSGRGRAVAKMQQRGPARPNRISGRDNQKKLLGDVK